MNAGFNARQRPGAVLGMMNFECRAKVGAFSLKTYESLLALRPEHRELLLSAARGFAVHAHLLRCGADRLESTNPPLAWELRSRVHGLYLRALDYALQGEIGRASCRERV